MGLFAGVDWGGDRHAVCVLDAEGKVVASFEVAHDASGISQLRSRLAKLAPSEELPIAIERPTGLIVDALVDAGHIVVPVNPYAVKAARPRFGVSCRKDDRNDARLLADLLRTDGHRFQRLVPQSDATKALRALVRSRDDLVAQRISMANQLRALLESFWPGPVGLFPAIDSPISLAFIERYPTPAHAEGLDKEALTVFLKDQRYSGRTKVSILLERLEAAPKSHAGTVETNAKGSLVAMMANLLQQLVKELATLGTRIEAAVAEHQDGSIIMSFPRAGRINAAQILSELGDVRERFQSEEQLAAEAGVAPVTRASGKSHSVVFRWACNHRLRRSLTLWAGNSRLSSPWAADIYKRARERGCDHPHAVRIPARAWVRVLWRAWVSRTTYDPEQHRAAKKLAA